jgi:hypothetical protein
VTADAPEAVDTAIAAEAKTAPQVVPTFLRLLRIVISPIILQLIDRRYWRDKSILRHWQAMHSKIKLFPMVAIVANMGYIAVIKRICNLYIGRELDNNCLRD